MTNFITSMKFTLPQMYRMTTTIAGAVVLIWGISGPLFKPLMAQELLQVLKDNGIDAETIKKLGEQGVDNGKNIDVIQSDVSTVKKELVQISDQLKAQNELDKRTQELLGQLLKSSLDRRTGDPQ